MRDLLALIIIATIVMAFITLPFMAITYFSCKEVTRITGRDTKYSMIGGCFVKDNYQFVPYEKWKVVNVNYTAGE